MTRQEKAVIYFLTGLTILGLAVKFYGYRVPPPDIKVGSVRFAREDIDVDKIIRQKQLVSINTAAAEDFQRLPGIGPALAARIIDYRSQNGDFGSCEDLQKVSGIGPKKYQAIKEYLIIE